MSKIYGKSALKRMPFDFAIDELSFLWVIAASTVFFNQVKEKELEKKRLRVGDKLSSFFWNQGALMEL